MSNTADDNQELTVEFNNIRLLVSLAAAVLLEWWDKFFLGFKKNMEGETFETKYKQLLILRNFVYKGKENNGLVEEVGQNIFFKHGRSDCMFIC